jgi:hypothetical protein
VPEHQQLSSHCPVTAEHQRSDTEDLARQQGDDLESHSASQTITVTGRLTTGQVSSSVEYSSSTG